MNPKGAVRCLVLVASLPIAGGCRRTPEAVQAEAWEPDARIVVDGPRDQVGFDRPIRLEAKVENVANSEAWSFRWQQVWGPAARKLEPRGSELHLVTPPPPTPEELAGNGGYVVPLTARTAGRMVFRIEASNGQRLLATMVEVVPAFPSAAWPRTPVGEDAYVAVLKPGEREALAQSGLRMLPSPEPYLARVLADGNRWYEVRHPDVEGWDMRAGTWLGSRDCGRAECHPNEYARWEQTRHGTVFKRAITGKLDPARGPYQRHCAACHTVGDQYGADNDGFDDRVAKSGWKFPERPSEAAWREVPDAVRDRANVQCESCHGAGWFYVGYGDDICGQCHDLPPRYAIYGQARRNRMSVAHESVTARTREGEVCGQCHVGADYLASLREHHSKSKPGRELETQPRGVTCAICHDPHGSSCDRQLRLCGYVEVPGHTFDAGQGALCVSCHNGEADVVQGPLPRPFVPGGEARAGRGHAPATTEAPRPPDRAPHAPQLQVLTGRGGRFLALPKSFARAPEYPHMGVPDSCVGCHYDSDSRHEEGRGHTFRLVAEPRIVAPASCARRMGFEEEKAAPQAPSCRKCHGPGERLSRPAWGDYDGDGGVEGIVEEVSGLLRLLLEEVDRHVAALGVRDADGETAATFAIDDERIVLANGDCVPLKGKDDAPVVVPADNEILLKAAFNYMLVARDGSGGIHNPHYVVRLLQSTIEELEKGRGETPRHRWRRLQ